MRVLFLNGRLSERGGADRWLLGVLAHLQGRLSTRLAVANRDPEMPADEERRVGSWSRIKGLDRRGLERHGHAPLAALDNCVDDFAPDLIHANDLVEPALLEWLADSGRAVLTIQDHRSFCPGRGKVDLDDRLCSQAIGDDCQRCFVDSEYGQRRIALTQRRLAAVRRAAAITVLSHYMRDELVAVGVEAQRIAVIPPFVDGLDLDADAGNGSYHLFAGRLVQHKGVATALAAANRLHVPLPLVIAGAGPMAAEVEAAAQRDPSHVRFVGWADRSAFADLLRGARSLWLPSLWAEPFGIVGLEAASAGVPVLASAAGGVRDWLANDTNGRLLTPGSVNELALAADELAADGSVAARLGDAGRRRVRAEFDSARCVDALLQVYDRVALNLSRR